jgi:putative transposase
MVRKTRIGLPGVPQHVIQRGNNKQACFFYKADYCYFLKLLHKSLEKNSCDLHAFVLMTNHVHFLVTPESSDGVSAMMMDLGRQYVRYVNDTYGRSGTLWEGRFKSSLIDSDRYCLACYRYIELNPVAAKLVSRPGDYRWSSFHANALGKTSDLINSHQVWKDLGSDTASRQKAYLALFDSALDPKDIEAIKYGARKELPVGSQQFKVRIEKSLSIKLGTGKRGRLKGVRYI